MATFDLVLLSSSPPTTGSSCAKPCATPPSNQQRVAMSSLALSPSPAPERQAYKSNGALKSGSRAAPVPKGVESGFATAGSLVKSHHFDLELDYDSESLQPGPPRNSSVRDLDGLKKQTTKTTSASNDAKCEPTNSKTRKPKVDTGEAAGRPGSRSAATATSSYFTNAADPPTSPSSIVPKATAAKTKTTKPRKPRAKKNKPGDVQEGPISTQAKVTKPRACTKSKLKGTNQSTSARSGYVQHEDAESFHTKGTPIQDVSHSPAHDTCVSSKNLPFVAQNEALDLSEAVARRREWTPAKDTIRPDALVDSTSRDENPPQVETHIFANIVSSFAFVNAVSGSGDTSNATESNAITTIKKRRIEVSIRPNIRIMTKWLFELIDVPGHLPPTRNSSPEKGKAPKKKARTITDLVTGQYVSENCRPASPPDNSDFSGSRAAMVKVPLNDVSNWQPGKTHAKVPQKRSTVKINEKKETRSKSRSKSKTTTLKTVAKPKMSADKLLSPPSALMRLNKQDILFGTSSQLALDESPTIIRQMQLAMRDSEQDVTLLPDVETELDAKLHSRSMQRVAKTGRLRGLWAVSTRDEEGRLLEKQKDLYMPDPDRTQDLPLLRSTQPTPSQGLLEDIGECQPLPQNLQVSSPTTTLTSLANKCDLKDNDKLFEDIDNYEPPPPFVQLAETSFLDIEGYPSPAEPPPPRSNIARTSLSTSPPIKEQGRPLRSPSAMVHFPPSSKSMKKASKSSIAAPAALETPRKNFSRFADIEEILDSEDDEALSPTPPKMSKLMDSAALHLSSSEAVQCDVDRDTSFLPVFKVPVVYLQWHIIKAQVFMKLTSAMRSLPPSSNPRSPSWYEKILMFVPIILEDFTAFINQHTSVRVWRRATQKQVKAFNKRQRTKGEKLLKVEDQRDELLVVEKELQTWMVQAWCEEMSICCIYREGRKGGVRKGLY